MKLKTLATLGALSTSLVAFPQLASADAFYDALTSGKAKLNMRTRFETVDQDGIDDTAEAFTLRTRLGYETGELGKTTAYVEFEDVSVVGGFDEYAPMSAGYPTVADPEVTELNQAFLSYKPTEGMNVKFGRQRVILDNARFVGNVGWRQNEQTFDALNFKYGVGGFDMTLAYFDQVHGIIPKFDALTEDIIANFGYKLPFGKITAYYYDLDHSHAKNDVQFEIETYGARFAGKSKLGDSTSLIYNLETAFQENATADKEAEYFLAELGAAISSFTVIGGYEVLGSANGAYGFQTPLATKHAFNGWADKFLVTPADGLEDMYIKGVAKLAGMKFVLVLHDYSGENSGDDFGSEINFLAVKPFAKKYTVGLKYASYSASDDTALITTTDTDKVWLFGELKF